MGILCKSGGIYTKNNLGDVADSVRHGGGIIQITWITYGYSEINGILFKMCNIGLSTYFNLPKVQLAKWCV